MKKHLVTIAPKRALTQPTRKAATKKPLASRAKAPAPKAQKTKAEADFDRAVQFRNTCPLLAAAPAAKRRMRATALAYAAELTVKKGGKR